MEWIEQIGGAGRDDVALSISPVRMCVQSTNKPSISQRALSYELAFHVTWMMLHSVVFVLGT